MMRDLGGGALNAWEAFVSVFGHGTAVVPGEGHVSCRRTVPLAPILPAQACGICMAAGGCTAPAAKQVEGLQSRVAEQEGSERPGAIEDGHLFGCVHPLGAGGDP